MSGGVTTSRAIRVAVAVSLVSLMMAPTRASAARPARCASAGRTYSANVIVEHKGGKTELKTLFLVCKPDHFVKIVDSDGRAYDDLDDFRAHNHLFSRDDKITVPRDFPSVDTTGRPGFGPAVSGHTGTSPLWWSLGGFVLVLIIAGGAFLVVRRRSASAVVTAADPPESSP
jgi:LPXTG-motif cell wall-anchored protein